MAHRTLRLAAGSFSPLLFSKFLSINKHLKNKKMITS